MSYNRISRINEEIKRELSSIIRTIKDPRVSQFVTIIAVDTTKDLKYCKIYVSVLDSDSKKEDTIIGLERASGYIKKELAKNVKMRQIPHLIFRLDDSIEYGAHISNLLKRVVPEEDK